MAILQQFLAILCAPLVLFTGFIGLRGNISDDYSEYKNVILLIGDGMSQVHVDAAKADGAESLIMETMPVRGESRTWGWPGIMLPDSASGGTALACGIDNIINQVSVFALDPLMLIATPATLAELAIENGRLAGVVTTDTTSGATPATFSAHAGTRNNEKKISEDQMASGIHLIWGAASESITEAGLAAGGYELITTRTEMLALEEGSWSFAQFDYGELANLSDEKDTPTLAEMTVKAIDLLDDGAGFFLMVEGAHIDKHAHSNDLEATVAHVLEFDLAVAAALAYAAEHPDTLVLVTADHETGGLKLQNGAFVFTSTGHTMANVPVFVSATDAGFTDGGAWKNRRIGVQLGRVMGFGADVFPTPVLPRLGA
ncbi:MAG: alkaline phosphatase [Oscillospiraceae bacterium]|nr:alkaline phosphatase [Oscillospiraceae bacterium]